MAQMGKMLEGKRMSQQKIAVPPSTIALGLAELLNRLTIEEKREFANIIDWDELQRLKVKTAENERKSVGEPRVYVGTTEDGLALELPIESVLLFVHFLPGVLKIDEIEVFILDEGGSKEFRCTAAELKNLLETEYLEVLREGSIMIELGPHTLVSGGSGCLSLSLENVPKETVREIASKALELCGFDYTFQKERFSAMVWKDLLEVKE